MATLSEQAIMLRSASKGKRSVTFSEKLYYDDDYLQNRRKSSSGDDSEVSSEEEDTDEDTEEEEQEEEASDSSSDDEEPAERKSSGPPIFKPYRPLLQRRTKGRKTSRIALTEMDVAPEVLIAKFDWARRNKDNAVIKEVINARNAEPPHGPLHRKLNQHVLDETLLYAMLSRNVGCVDALLEGKASVKGADSIFDDAKGNLSSCECESHPGMLLIALIRQASSRMVEIALEELSVNTYICDGATRRLWWDTGYTFQGLQPVKMPVLKSQVRKTTPLSAAVETGDLNLVQLLTSRGAELLAHDCVAFIEAAKGTHDKKHRILKYLFNRLTSSPNFPSSRKIVEGFETAAAAALRSAAEHGDVNKLRCVIETLEAEQDWISSSKGGNKGRRPSPIFKRASSEELFASVAPGSHSSLHSHASWNSGMSGSNGNLASHSMINYHAQRTSHCAIKPLINDDALARKQPARLVSAVRPRQNFTLVERVVAKAIGQLVEEGADPMLADRRGLSRALEGLALLDATAKWANCGAERTGASRLGPRGIPERLYITKKPESPTQSGEKALCKDLETSQGSGLIVSV